MTTRDLDDIIKDIEDVADRVERLEQRVDGIETISSVTSKHLDRIAEELNSGKEERRRFFRRNRK